MTQLDVAAGFEGGLAVVNLAIFLDRFTAALAEQPRRGPRTRLRAHRTAPASAPVVAEAPKPAVPATN